MGEEETGRMHLASIYVRKAQRRWYSRWQPKDIGDDAGVLQPARLDRPLCKDIDQVLESVLWHEASEQAVPLRGPG